MAVPKLRFKEFDGNWYSNKIGEISECIVPGRNKPKKFNGDIPWVTTPDLQGNIYVSDTKSDSYISEDEAKNVGSKIVPVNSVIMSCVGDLGLFAINKKRIVINQQLHAFLLDNNKYDSLFILNALSKNKNYIDKVATKTALPYLNKDNCNSIPLYLSTFQEQTKIASFLSAVDEKISQLKQKHQLLSQYKQGMMQKLFSQQIRFRADDGSEFGEWASEKISKVFTNKSKSFNPLLNESLPCIELEHLSQNTGQILGTVNSSDQQSTKNLFEPNSVLYGKLRPYLRKFAKPQFKGVCSSEIWVLTGLKISNDYLFQFVQSEQFTELTNIQSGSKMPRADWNVIADAEIEFPCLGEQTKIANFLSSIDQKIEVVAQQIEQAKQWKKGLLQNMFI